MRRFRFAPAVLVLLIPALPAILGPQALQATGQTESPKSAAARRVERGAYLVRTSACTDCHTPLKMGPTGPAPDMARALTGHPAELTMPAPPTLPPGPWGMVASATNTAWSGPWGISFTANLTPDKETGLGNWTEEMFLTALRTGRHEGKGRPILPPMPWSVYGKMTDEDLKSIFAYLQSLPPVHNRVPQPIDPPEVDQ